MDWQRGVIALTLASTLGGATRGAPDPGSLRPL
jgi:hypothetical protein